MRPNILDPLDPSSPGFGERLQKGSQDDMEAFQQHLNNVENKYSSFPLNTRISENIAGNYISGPPPYNPNNTSDLIHSREQWGQDPYSYGKPTSFGAGERDLDFDKYYSRSNFKKFGFVPHRDNDTVYNENTSWLSDFGRAIPQIIKLAGIGFRDMETEWADFGGKPDVQHAAEMQRAIQLGSTTRGGIGGWAINFATNAGYTIGIMTAMVAEELALAGITAAAGGFDLPVTGPLAVARGAMAANKIGSFAKATRAWAEAFKVIRTPEQASSFYKATKATGNFLNPLERTMEFAGEFNKLKGMSDYAKVSRGAMALFGDIRMLNAVSSESKLEGGFMKIDKNKEQIDEFYNKNGRLPNEEEMKGFNEISDQAANWATMSNIPLIYLSNKVVFDGAMKGFKVLRESGAETAAKEAAGKLGKVLAGGKLVGKYTLAGGKELLRPGNLLKGSLRYTSKNLMEGLQESSQEVIHNTLMDYYKQFYNDPTISSMKSSFGRGLLSQVSAQGLDTFIQGFLMGGLIGAVQKPLFTTLPNLGRKIFAPEAYNKWKTEKEAYVNNFTNTYNEIRKNPKKYVDSLNATDENFVAQSLFNEYIKKVADPKTTMDLKDESAFHHVYSMLQNGQYSILEDLVNDYKKMTPEQLTEAFGDPASDNLNMTPKERLSNFEKKLGIVKNIWDNHIKTHPNPITPEQAKQSEEAFNYHQEFEMYRKIALFAHYSFERAADRTSSILEQATRNKPLSKASSSDFSVLYSPTDLKDQLKALRQEISLLKGIGDADSRLSLKSKQERLEALSQYRDVAIKLQKALKNKSDEVESLNQELHKSYSQYLRAIADEYDEPLLNSKTDETFISVKDFYANHQDRLDMARAVNMFSNPEYIQELLTRLHSVKSTLDNTQVDLAKDGLLTAIDKIKDNALLNELFNHGILIADNDPFLEGEAPAPTKFYNASDHQPVSPEKEAEAKEIVRIWLEQTSESIPPPAPVSAQPPPPSTSPDLENKLRNAFFLENTRRAAENEPKLHNFNDFVKTNSIALDIIAANTKPGPIVNIITPGTPSILPEFKGKIIYMTATVGKTTAAAKYPDQLIDGDQLLLDFLNKKDIQNSGDLQKSGLDFWRYLKTFPEQEELLIEEFQDYTEDIVKSTGKTLLTGSKYLKAIADKAYLTSDVTRVAKIFRERGQKNYTDSATKFINEDQDFFQDSGFTPIGPDIFAENILTGMVPAAEIDTRSIDSITKRLNNINTLTELNKLQEELLQEVTEGKLDGKVAKQAVAAKKKQLITDVSYDRIKNKDILIMTDKVLFGPKGHGQVISVTPEEILVRKWYPGMKPTTATEAKRITPETLRQEVSLIYDDAMTDEDITPAIDPASEQVAKDNVKPSEDLKAKIEARKKNQTHNGEDLLDKPDC